MTTKTGFPLKKYHHIRLDSEFRLDCQMWTLFLEDLNSVVRPFIDLDATLNAQEINFYSDSSAKSTFGFGAIFNNNWLFGKWESSFINDCKPSIEFLELFALCAGIFTWEYELRETRIVVFCDNISVVHMVNNLTSSCHQCMKLLRLLTLNNLRHDRCVFVRHVKGKNNQLSDALSRQNLRRFFALAPKTVNPYPDHIHPDLWPLTKIWNSPTISC